MNGVKKSGSAVPKFIPRGLAALAYILHKMETTITKKRDSSKLSMKSRFKINSGARHCEDSATLNFREAGCFFEESVKYGDYSPTQTAFTQLILLSPSVHLTCVLKLLCYRNIICFERNWSWNDIRVVCSSSFKVLPSSVVHQCSQGSVQGASSTATHQHNGGINW